MLLLYSYFAFFMSCLSFANTSQLSVFRWLASRGPLDRLQFSFLRSLRRIPAFRASFAFSDFPTEVAQIEKHSAELVGAGEANVHSGDFGSPEARDERDYGSKYVDIEGSDKDLVVGVSSAGFRSTFWQI